MFQLRLATNADLPTLRELIPLSARSLSADWYSAEQIESAIRYVFGPDSQLIADQTYFVAVEGREILGCGGWSRRSTLYGGDQMKSTVDPLLDPARDAARIRAFFVHPAFARRGIGAAVLHACMDAASRAGFTRAELMATLPGVPLYRRFGFEEVESVSDTLPNGISVPFVRMARAIPSPPAMRSVSNASTRLTQHVPAPRAAVYLALLDPAAVATWMVPDDMTSHIHEFDAREGGAFRITLTYDAPTGTGKSTAHSDTYHGRFVELVPDERVVEVLEFETDDPAMQGEMSVTFTLTDAAGGTLVSASHDHLPPGLPPADNELGWRLSLGKLAELLAGARPR